MNGRAIDWLQRLLLLVPPALLGWLGWGRRWVTDDAFIDLRIVQHLLAGYGPLYNVGERVEAYTNPLWVGLLAVGAAAIGAVAGDRVPLERISVAFGLALAVGGTLAAQAGALRLWRRAGCTGPALPLGVLAVVPLNAQWDFVTSGLETGLTTGWLGATFFVLSGLMPSGGATGSERGRGEAPPIGWAAGAARGAPAGAPYTTRRLAGVAVLAGLGPLIRPDLAVYSAGWLLLLALVTVRRGGPLLPALGRGLVVVEAGLALPALYQVFRMGYFAALLPNTALAKEAGMTYWPQGWRYLADFVGTYWLWIPLAALGAWWLGSLAALARARRGEAAALAVVPVACALVHALYVVRVGGDFMHGRMLLPALFALVLPVATAAGPRWWGPLLPSLVVALWAAVAGVGFRPLYHGVGNGVGPQGIADERTFYVRLAGGHPNPVTLAEYAAASWARDGHALRTLAEQRRVLLPRRTGLADAPPNAPPPVELPLVVSMPAGVRVVAHRTNIGLTGYAAGPKVHLVDHLGLADPLAARLRLGARKRPGHEKELPDDWVVARFAVTAEHAAFPGAPAAREALACGEVAALLEAVGQPLTPERFLRNLGRSVALTQLRLPAGPAQARAELCRRR